MKDDGGTANGGIDLDPTPNIIQINVTSVNDAPTATSATVNVAANGTRPFSAADFPMGDPNDTPANHLANVIITSLPATAR